MYTNTISGSHWSLQFQILLLAAIIDDIDIDNIDIDNIENIDASLCRCESWDDTEVSPIPDPPPPQPPLILRHQRAYDDSSSSAFSKSPF